MTGLALWAFSCIALATPALAQVSSQDRACIIAFNTRIRKVAKEQDRVIKKCLQDFAGGKLVAMTVEDCVSSDPDQKVDKALQKAQQIINKKCPNGFPAFGATATTTSLPETILSQIDLAHGSLGANLDTALIANATDAGCQSKVMASLLQCQDTRLREYLKCQKQGLLAGTITDAASMATVCLGSGAQSQPDANQTIALKCNTKVAATVGQRCAHSNLLQTFTPCDVSDVNGVTTCLRDQSACQLCLMMNNVDGLTRDCDLFDDGNGANGSCGSKCPDGVVQPGETCDDDNAIDGDGCSSQCRIEGGWTCTGKPSVCTKNCGNGVLDAGEACDDHNATSGDGCSNSCTVESGYSCTGQPSVCTKICGNGVLDAGEACDDHNGTNGDGCSSTCQVEPGYQCTGSPSVCTFVCGNGTFQGPETCDDNNHVGGDGCSAVCQIETGWLCSGQPSHCTPKCGDGLLVGGEACDDGNVQNGDGCSLSCQVEPGYQCSGQPSNCVPVCGDGFIRGLENCDDHNVASGDGCSGSFCRQEVGFTCVGQPSVCTPNCGNAILDPFEECDDGNNNNGDGCSSTCHAETGYACAGQPSVCVHTCGNGLLDGPEQCDDGNTLSGDGCSSSCRRESGWLCGLPGTACNRFEIFIDSPAHGTFTTAGSITVSGHYTTLPVGTAAVTINGVPVITLNQVTRTFSTTVTLNASTVFNPVFATLTNILTGDDVHARIVVIDGQSVANGAYSPQSVALRINDTGLQSMEPLVSSLASSQLNLGQLLPPGTVIDDECFINVIGCLGSARVTIANPAPSYSGFSIAMDSQVNSVFADIDVQGLRIDVDIQGSGLVPDCGLRLTANDLFLTGNYALEPKVGDPTNVNVDLITPMGVSFAGFNHEFTSGLCDAPIIGDIIQALLPDIQTLAVNGIKGFLDDPDGAGPQKSPVAQAIQDTLAGISIAGPVGAGLGLMLDTPLFEVAEDNAGITFGSDSKFTVSIGNGAGQCIPPVGAPVLTRSYSKPETFPTFTATTPVGHVPYGLGIGISSAGFNQLLRGQTECGLMRSSLTTIDLDGPGGQPPVAVTSTLLSLLIPEFSQLPPNTPLRIDIAPTLAPIVTGNPGPNGELAELKIAQVQLTIVQPGPETVWLQGALDARLGLNLAFKPDGTGLAITLSTPALSDLSIAITYNPLGTNETTVETVLPSVVQPLIPELAGALSGFPLPQFFGLSLGGVEVSRQGEFLSLFANLTTGP